MNLKLVSKNKQRGKSLFNIHTAQRKNAEKPNESLRTPSRLEQDIQRVTRASKSINIEKSKKSSKFLTPSIREFRQIANGKVGLVKMIYEKKN